MIVASHLIIVISFYYDLDGDVNVLYISVSVEIDRNDEMYAIGSTHGRDQFSLE